MRKRVTFSLLLIIAMALPVAAADNSRPMPGFELWQDVGRPASVSPSGSEAEVRPARFKAFALNRSGMASLVAGAPRTRAAGQRLTIISLPSPNGGFTRFAVAQSEVMEPGLAAKHPEIKTYAGRGLDDPRLTIHADMTPLGFHASVRGPGGAWFIDPYYRGEQSVYVSYYGRDLKENAHGPLVENDTAPGVSVDRAYYPGAATVELNGGGFATNSPMTITISDPQGNFASRIIELTSDDNGSFSTTFTADEQSNLGTHQVDATDGTNSASVTYDVVDADSEVPDPPVGPQLRTYRLAFLTDNTYATYFGGSANVTPAKVTLINRVTHVYETETSIRLVLIASNDLLNLDTPAQMTGTNGPCGAAACFSASQASTCASSTLTRNRQVIGLLVGASNFDVGHIGLGQNGGGVASLGVVGLNNKAQGCTGLTTPVGDFYAVDYVAHEMGHQFAGNHTFNGTVSNCSGGNRNAGTSVEPGSGSSIMAYAGICGTDNLQPHSDPYWSERSFDEIVAHTSAAEINIAEVQMAALTGFDGTDSFQLQYNGNNSAVITRGTNYTTAGIKAAIEGISGFGGTVTITALTDGAFTITFAGTAQWNVLQIVNASGFTGYIGEIAKGGLTTRQGSVSATGNNFPTVTTAAAWTIPVRTPFVLTGSATDPDGDALTYMWEQNDRAAATGTGLISNTKLNGPLFRQFGVAAIVSASDTLLYESPGENHTDSNPTRVFPDMAQILANNTNAEAGTCPTASTPPTAAQIDCFSEYLPTAAYTGFGANASPARLNFRLTARDGKGGVNSAATVLTLATAAGPFLVTSPNTAVVYKGGSTQTVTWNVAGTDVAPVSTSSVKITLSADGGNTFPYVLAASTANDGSETVSLPNIGTTQARVKIEAVGNIFFDVSNSNFTVQALPVVTNDAPAGGAFVQYSDALAPAVTISATDADTAGSALTASATGLPAGLSLAVASTGANARTWTVAGNVSGAPGTYNVVVTVTDDTAGTATTSFTIVVTQENASATYTGDLLAFTAPGGSTASVVLRATVIDIADGARGVITNATVTFKEGATTLCGPLAVALIGADPTVGSASCSASLTADTHAISVIVNNFYTGSTTTLVEVAQPDGSFITGGGYTVASSSAGSYAADAGTNINGGYNVKYNKGGKNLQGQVNIRFQSGGRFYQLKSTAMDSLGVVLRKSDGTPCGGPPSATCFGIADFRSKANLTDVTDAIPVAIFGNLSLQMTVTDKGEPGSADSIGVTAWNGPTLVFSTNWNGAQTVEQVLGGGNAVVH